MSRLSHTVLVSFSVHISLRMQETASSVAKISAARSCREVARQPSSFLGVKVLPNQRNPQDALATNDAAATMK